MKDLRLSLLSLLILGLVLGGCAKDDDDNDQVWQETAETISEEYQSPALAQTFATLQGLTVEGDAQNERLLEDVTVKLGLVDQKDEAKLQTLADELDDMAAGAEPNTALADFSELLDEVLMGGADADTDAPAPVTFEDACVSETRIVVSDGITRAGAEGIDAEILPTAVVYNLDENKTGFFNYLTAGRVKDAQVQFWYKRKHFVLLPASWHRLGEPLTTDDKGRVQLDALSTLLDNGCFPEGGQAQRDLQLKAEVVVADGTVKDDLGIIRVLSTETESNHDLIVTDHDNTLHETGALTSLEDILDFINSLRDEWPLVDSVVDKVVPNWLQDDNDVIIVSSMLEQMRAKTREQMLLHFEDGNRRIPIIVKSDMPYEHSGPYKSAAIVILKTLYGPEHVRGMVGDTATSDGYGAFDAGVLYVPFQIHYNFNSTLLDTEGYGAVDPDTIAWDWNEVMEMIEGGSIAPKNVWLRNNAFMNIAHRGGGELAPEDTLAAYFNALQEGAHAIEGDCHLTSDGVLVLSHDATVDRCTDGEGAINEMTFAEVRALDAGYRYTPDNGKTYPWRGQGIQIPTVREMFDFLTAEHPDTPMILEVKSKEHRDEAVTKLLALIDEFDEDGSLVNRLQLGAFNQEALDYMKEIGEQDYNFDLVRCFSTEGVLDFAFTPFWELIKPDYEFPGEVLALPWAVVTPCIMDKARRTGTNVNVWTVNTKIEMLWLKNVMHVDGIMTDNPATLAEVITEH